MIRYIMIYNQQCGELHKHREESQSHAIPKQAYYCSPICNGHTYCYDIRNALGISSKQLRL